MGTPFTSTLCSAAGNCQGVGFANSLFRVNSIGVAVRANIFFGVPNILPGLLATLLAAL
jgi:hypothetical protein